MSPSPTDTGDRAGITQYANAWRAIIEMVRRGDSWSGHERNCTFLNCGQLGTKASSSSLLHASGYDRQFANISAVSGLDFADDGRAVAVTDWDQDGDLDLWLANRTAPRLRLMLNRSEPTASSRSFVAFKLEGNGKTTNRDAIGAVVEVDLEQQTSQDSSRSSQLVKTLRAGEGFLSQNSKWLHFGLGANPRIRGTIVHWPGGVSERFADIEQNQRYFLRQGSGRAVSWTRDMGTKRQVKLVNMPPPPEAPSPRWQLSFLEKSRCPNWPIGIVMESIKYCNRANGRSCYSSGQAGVRPVCTRCSKSLPRRPV